jgi:CubicO group peptidase (beta-lactamase class C family)
MSDSLHTAIKLPALAYTSTIADGRTEILKELAKTDAVTHAVSVALLDDQHILWEEAFGLIDKTQGLRPNPETLFCIASLSKIVATVGTMMLVDRGLVVLDEPVSRYVRDFRMADGEAWRKITVRMLLNHSSGLPGTHFADVLTIVPVAGYAIQLQRNLARERLKHAPGEMAVYCNDGFTLIERVVAEVSGQAYVDFVRREILEPLGMRRTRFALERFAPGSFAAGLDGAGRPEPQEYVNVYAGGLFSTPGEIARLAMMFLNDGQLEGRRLLSAEAVAEMGRDQTEGLPFNPITDHPVHFGLGWDGVNQGGLAAVGVTAWHKSGDADHYHSHLIVVPKERLAAIVMVTNALSMGGIAGLLAERILLHALAERGSILKVPEPVKPAPMPAVPATNDDLAAIAGTYASAYGLRQMTVQPDRTVTLSMYAKGEWKPMVEGLKLRQDGRFISDRCPGTAYRLVVAGGRRYLAVRGPFGTGHFEAELPDSHDLAPGKPLSNRWQSRIGRRWLAANDAYSPFLALGRQPPLFSLLEVKGLANYIAADVIGAGMETVQVLEPGESDSLARMCLKIPLDNGWGLSDLEIVERDGEEWVLWAGILYRPLATVPFLDRHLATITIGSEGLGEWRQVPATLALTVSGARIWRLYDAEFSLSAWGLEEGEVGEVPAGAYLFVHGTPGSKIKVALT